jgi:hypothetical protein
LILIKNVLRRKDNGIKRYINGKGIF